ncbi:MAG: ATP-binding cassette domain-containing protein, partial [Burkholderiaceae bacterium]
MSLLTVRELSVRFAGKAVVDRVSFNIEAGEKFALVGESGSGKTVSALQLMGMTPEADTSGSIVFEDRQIRGMSDAQLRALRGKDIAMIFQEPMTALNPLFTIG